MSPVINNFLKKEHYIYMYHIQYEFYFSLKILDEINSCDFVHVVSFQLPVICLGNV